MKLGQLLSDYLLVESIHPDLHAAAVNINKKVAEQLKDIPIFKTTEDPKLYRSGWILGYLNNTPVSMMLDGSVTMEVNTVSGAHNTWESIDKFLIYAKRRHSTPPAVQFVKRISNSMIRMAKDGTYLLIIGWNLGEIAKYVGLDLPVKGETPEPHAPGVYGQLPALGRTYCIAVTSKAVWLVHRDSDDRYIKDILTGKDTVNGYMPEWPQEVTDELKKLYRKEAKGWINDVERLDMPTLGTQLDPD